MPEPVTPTESHHELSWLHPEYPFLERPVKPGDIGALGKYRLKSLLGAGGMGYVFLAHDPVLGRDVALKVMRPEEAANPKAKERFLREGRAVAGLKSDHVVVIHDVGGDCPGEVPYLAMEHLTGQPLDGWLKVHGRKVPTELAVRFGHHALRGLAAAHDRNLVHRDIKPSNLWVELPAGRIKILDFGLARDAAGDDKVTTTGTACYMAPEQAHALPVDGRADLYSLGVVLYEMLTGTNPFDKGSFLASLIAVENIHPPQPQEVVPEVPADLSAFVHKLMSKSPTDRPPDAKTALAELTAIRDRMKAEMAAARGSGSSAVVLDVPVAELAKSDEFPTFIAVRRRPLWLATGVAGAVFAGLVGAWAGRAFRTPESDQISANADPDDSDTAAAVLKLVPDRRPAPPPTALAKSADTPAARKGGEERSFEIAPGVRMAFCWVPAGEAQLGSPTVEQDYIVRTFFDGVRPVWVNDENETTRGKFTTKGFWLAKYEVTQNDWLKVTGKRFPARFNGRNDNAAKGMNTARFPVEQVSWIDAVEFCNRMSEGTGRTPRYRRVDGGKLKTVSETNGFRLPSENEWEYACRGGKGNRQPFYFGDLLNGIQANCNGIYPYGTVTKGNYKERTCAVDDTNGGKYIPHPWGLFHMHGNVWEWCENEYPGNRRPLRGGSWYDVPTGCSVANESLSS